MWGQESILLLILQSLLLLLTYAHIAIPLFTKWPSEQANMYGKETVFQAHRLQWPLKKGVRKTISNGPICENGAGETISFWPLEIKQVSKNSNNKNDYRDCKASFVVIRIQGLKSKHWRISCCDMLKKRNSHQGIFPVALALTTAVISSALSRNNYDFSTKKALH